MKTSLLHFYPGMVPLLVLGAFAARAADPAPVASSTTSTAEPATSREERRAQYEEHQTQSFDRMRQRGQAALAAADARRATQSPAHDYFVNNQTGDDGASGLSPEKAVRTLGRAVALLKPGDTLNLAVTSAPYRETLQLDDGFGGLAGKPIVIDGHGATITGSEPLRQDGWQETPTPGLYKSTKFLNELEEFGDAAKLIRVYFLFDGVMQHMRRTSKGAKAPFKDPGALAPGEWTYIESEKAFYLKVKGALADARIEAPYRRNGVAIRSPKVAMTHVLIKNLTVCHVLNDGFNVHGTTQDLRFENIAAYECGDDGFSPHDTCEITIDGYWATGNSTGIANANLSSMTASDVQLEGNLAHQFMAGHGTKTELRNSIIKAGPGTPPLSFMSSQDARLTLDNVQVSASSSQKVVNIPGSQIELRHCTAVGPGWENSGAIRVSQSVVGGTRVTNLAGGSWTGDGNVYAIAFNGAAENTNCQNKSFGPEVLHNAGSPFPGEGADPGQFKIPPRPLPLPAAGKFTALASNQPLK